MPSSSHFYKIMTSWTITGDRNEIVDIALTGSSDTLTWNQLVIAPYVKTVMARLSIYFSSVRLFPSAGASNSTCWLWTLITVTSRNKSSSTFDTSNKSISDFVQLLLDCSVVPEVIEANQNSDSSVMAGIFKFSRTWCFNVHMKRMKMLGRWTKI